MGFERDATGTRAKVRVDDKDATPGELAAQQGADPERLLDGEDPDTLQVHDADHWIRVYRDLLEFKQRLLSSAQEMVPAMDVAARHEVGQTDMIAMDAEATKFQRRLEYWQARRDELGGRP
ncbi:MAG: hypothetical protein M3077_08260 [Candidatus Dormibacteraeota bacterium]|nr:hypothetical protein [Candidatus Dormibacteraeota bacterium]